MNRHNALLAAAGAGGAAATIAGLALAAKSAIVRFESLDIDAYPLPGNRFWVHGVAVHYVERGSGFPVVLVPGWAASTFSYRLLIGPLAEQFRVIALDLPGFGFSERSPEHDYSLTSLTATLRDLLRRLGVQRAVLVGHSMGGAVVERLAAEAPELVERLILIDAISAADPRREPRLAQSRLVAFFLQGLFALRPALLRRALRRVVADPAFVATAELDGYLTPLRLPGTAAVMRRMIEDVQRDQAVDLGRIAAPTLVIQGEQDRLVPMRTAQQLAGAIPGSRLAIVPNAGHLVPEEQPEETVRQIVEFLAGLPAAPPSFVPSPARGQAPAARPPAAS